jgi:hypothetical protein
MVVDRGERDAARRRRGEVELVGGGERSSHDGLFTGCWEGGLGGVEDPWSRRGLA